MHHVENQAIHQKHIAENDGPPQVHSHFYIQVMISIKHSQNHSRNIRTIYQTLIDEGQYHINFTLKRPFHDRKR